MTPSRHRKILVSSSALILAASYLITFLWWTVFIFLIPLFFCALKYPIKPYKDGLVWGLLFWTIHYYGIVYVIYEKGEGEWRLLAGLFLILYSSLYVILWFAIAKRLAHLRDSSSWKVVCWIVATFFYFYWVRYYMFFIFNQKIGYSFGLPTLLLAHSPKTLVLLPTFGTNIFLLITLASGGMAALALYERSYCKLLFALAVLVPFGVGFVWQPPAEKPKALNLFGYITPISSPSPYECAVDINEKITELLIRHPSVQYVVMPESAYPFYLNEDRQALELWRTNALRNNACLLLGSYRNEKTSQGHNSFYHIQEGRIISFYDKRLQFPFIEYHPWNHCEKIKELFLKNKKEFTCSKRTAHPFILSDTLSVMPMLCSDLFFDLPLSTNNKWPIVCAVNDNWFSILYMRKLMLLFAVYKSIETSHDIIYVSYSHGVWLSPSTHCWNLLKNETNNDDKNMDFQGYNFLYTES